MPGSISVTRALGGPEFPPEADFGICFIGTSSESPVAAGRVSASYGVPSAIASDFGIGDVVDAAMQAVSKTNANPAPGGVSVYRTPLFTIGAYGTIDVSGVTGSALPAVDTGTQPLGTYEAWLRVRTGGVVGFDGIEVEYSLDNGRTIAGPVPLHTDTSFTFPNDEAGFLIGPSGTAADFVALAVELRADALAHFADAVAHDGADATAAALITLGAPSTPTQSVAVVNQVRLALASHERNITAHNGPDGVNIATLGAATNPATGIALANELKAVIGAHFLETRAAVSAGLHAATATVAAPVTVLAAAMLSGGIVAMDLFPSRISVKTGASNPTDAPATVAISGFDIDGAAQSETLALSQSANGEVFSVKAYKGTSVSLVFAAADGTGTTLTIGYGQAVHNSADVTNSITSPYATLGTLVAGDVFKVNTIAPTWQNSGLYDVTDPDNIVGAFAAIAESDQSFGLVVITEPVPAGSVSTLIAGLDYMATFNKRPTLIIRFRDKTHDVPGETPVVETDAEYIAAFRAWRATFAGDARICCVVGGGWVTDSFTARRYLRSGLAPLMARLQSFNVKPEERIAHSPAFGGDGPLENFTIVDDEGNLIGHDEFTRGGIDGPISGGGGGITFCFQRADGIEGTYVSEAPCLYPQLSKVLTLMDNRVSSGIERELYAVAWTMIQGADIVRGTTLDPDAVDAMASRMRSAIVAKFSREIANPDDPNLVVVNPTVIKSGSSITISVSINDELFLYVDGINITIQNNRS